MELQELVVVPIVRAGLTAVKYAPTVIEGAQLAGPYAKKGYNAAKQGVKNTFFKK